MIPANYFKIPKAPPKVGTKRNREPPRLAGVGIYKLLFKNKDFLLLWANQAFSRLAYHMVNFTLVIWVFKLTHSSLAVSSLLLSFFISSFLFSLPGGIYTDVFNRRKIMTRSSFLWTLVILLLSLGKENFFLILLVSFLMQAIDEFFLPAQMAVLPNVVSKGELLLANSCFSLTANGALILGFGLAGPLMRFVGDSAPFGVAVLLSILAALCVWLMSPLRSYEGANRGNFFGRVVSEFREGLDILRKNRNVIPILAFIVALRGVASPLGILAPAFAEKSLGIDAKDASFLFVVPLGLGLVLGSTLLSRSKEKEERSNFVSWGIFLGGGALLSLAASPTLRDFFIENNGLYTFEHLPELSSIVAFLMIFLGMGGTLVLIPLQTALQEITPDKLRGRIHGFLNMGSYIAAALPTLFIGFLADIVGPAFLLGLLGLFALVAGLMLKGKGFLTKVQLSS